LRFQQAHQVSELFGRIFRLRLLEVHVTVVGINPLEVSARFCEAVCDQLIFVRVSWFSFMILQRVMEGISLEK
jgi:hypothetical protein